MEYEIHSKVGKQKRMLERLMPGYLKHLGIANAKGFITIVVEKRLDREGGAIRNPEIPELYYIVVSGALSQRLLATAVAHELVHIKQMVKGQLRTTIDGRFFWCGKEIFPADMDYFDLPWEVQAYAKQEITMIRAAEAFMKTTGEVRNITAALEAQ